ncbi:hypothetical protein Ct61P_04232 [Colletotrichum tofieldiae]|nr:hypothetical protein Ct61P_04232 [Colletotrichum tofieldiae]
MYSVDDDGGGEDDLVLDVSWKGGLQALDALALPAAAPLCWATCWTCWTGVSDDRLCAAAAAAAAQGWDHLASWRCWSPQMAAAIAVHTCVPK